MITYQLNLDYLHCYLHYHVYKNYCEVDGLIHADFHADNYGFLFITLNGILYDSGYSWNDIPDSVHQAISFQTSQHPFVG